MSDARSSRRATASLSLSLLVGAPLVMGSLAQPAFGQAAPPDHYQVINLGTLNGWSDDSQYIATAINNDNVIVGHVAGTYGGASTTHAWVWAPCGQYGLPAGQMVDLTALLGIGGCTDGSCIGIAYGINDAGIVVGDQVTEFGGVERPFVWNLATDEYFPLTNPGGRAAVAFAISDADPPVVVGDRYVSCGTGCNRREAFRWTYAGPSSTTITSVSPNSSLDSFAYDVNDLSSPRAVGYAGTDASTEACHTNIDAGRWTLSGSSFTFEYLAESPYTYSPVRTIAHATNNAELACGEIVHHTTGAICVSHSVLWDADGDLLDLGDPSVVYGLASGIQTVADGLSQVDGSGLVNVVGGDLTDARALVWHRDASLAWSVVQVDTRIDSDAGWTSLSRAFATNASGWVAGRGYRTSGVIQVVRAFAVHPGDPPLGDINGDDWVNGSDLGILIGSWGPCASCSNCPADLDGDCAVGSSDLAILLGAWGFACPSGGGSGAGMAAQSAIDAEAATGAIPVDSHLAEALGMFGFESLEQFATWAATNPPEIVEPVALSIAAILGGNQP